MFGKYITIYNVVKKEYKSQVSISSFINEGHQKNVFYLYDLQHVMYMNSF